MLLAFLVLTVSIGALAPYSNQMLGTGRPSTLPSYQRLPPWQPGTATDWPLGNTNFTTGPNPVPAYWSWNQTVKSGSPTISRGWDINGFNSTPAIYESINGISSAKAAEDYYQAFTHTGTIPVNQSWIGLRWRCSYVSYPTWANFQKMNNISVVLITPSGIRVTVWSHQIPTSANNSWSYPATTYPRTEINITNWINMYGTGKYTLSVHLNMTAAPSTTRTYVTVYWDDVFVVLNYKPQYAPQDLSLRINSNATYSNSRSVVLRLVGYSIQGVFLSNDGLTYEYAPFTVIYVGWVLTAGDGVKTVFFKANNTVQKDPPVGPVNDTIILDGTTPPAPTRVAPTPEDGSTIGDNKPTIQWTCSDLGSNISYYELQIDASYLFDNSTGQLANWTNPIQSYYVPPLGLANGLWHWRVRAVDKAGNVGNYTVGSFRVNVVFVDPLMVTLIAGGGSGGVIFLIVIGYYLAKRARIPFIVKKIDESIKLITRGEVTSPVPLRSRAQTLETIYQGKLAILSREKLEEPVGTAKMESQPLAAPVFRAEALEVKQTETEAKTVAESSESEVDAIAKELETLGAKEELEPVEETDLIRKEIEELEKAGKRKKKS